MIREGLVIRPRRSLGLASLSEHGIRKTLEEHSDGKPWHAVGLPVPEGAHLQAGICTSFVAPEPRTQVLLPTVDWPRLISFALDMVGDPGWQRAGTVVLYGHTNHPTSIEHFGTVMDFVYNRARISKDQGER